MKQENGHRNRGRNMEMEILFEDRYILVVNKPEGLLTNSTILKQFSTDVYNLL